MTYASAKMNHLNGVGIVGDLDLMHHRNLLPRFDRWDDIQLFHDFVSDPGDDYKQFGPISRIVFRGVDDRAGFCFVGDVTLKHPHTGELKTIEIDVAQVFAPSYENRESLAREIDAMGGKVSHAVYCMFSWWSTFQEYAFMRYAMSPGMIFEVWAKERKMVHDRICAHPKGRTPKSRKKLTCRTMFDIMHYTLLHERDVAIAKLKDENDELRRQVVPAFPSRQAFMTFTATWEKTPKAGDAA